MSYFSSIYSKRDVHRRIIDSEEWQTCHCEDGLANEGVFTFHIKTGANTAHGNLVYWAEGKIKISLYKGATVTGDGTVVTTQNVNRETAGTPTTAVYHTPTTTADGTLFCTAKMGQAASGGIFGNPAVGGNLEGGYWLLKPNTSYLVKIENESGEAVDFCMNYEWHEHDAVV